MQRTPFDIPDQMRNATEQSIEQARKALEQFMGATQEAVAKAEGSASAFRFGAGDLQRQAMAYMEENITASFAFAERLVQARTMEEVAALQQEFVTRQLQSAAAQGQSLGEMIGRAATGGAAGKKEK